MVIRRDTSQTITPMPYPSLPSLAGKCAGAAYDNATGLFGEDASADFDKFCGSCRIDCSGDLDVD
jgi:hypothetical protein